MHEGHQVVSWSLYASRIASHCRAQSAMGKWHDLSHQRRLCSDRFWLLHAKLSGLTKNVKLKTQM